MNETRYPFVRFPIELLQDTRVPGMVKLLWCHLDIFAREVDARGRRRPPDIKRLQVLMDVGERSIYRWLAVLESHGWLEWQRKAERDERLVPLTPDDRATRPSGDLIARIHTMLQTDASVEEYRAVMQAILPLLSEELSPESELLSPESDDLIVESELLSPESDDLIVESELLSPRSEGLSPRSELLSPESDDLIVVTNQEAIHGITTPQKIALDSSSSNSSFKKRKLLPTTPPTATERWLIEQNIDPRLARTWRTLDLAAVQSDYQRRRDLGAGVGAIVEAWKVAPPTAPRPVVQAASAPALASSDEAQRRAATIAPEDASPDELALLVSEIEAGANDDQALDYLYTRRWQAAHLPTIRAEVAA